MIEIFIESTAEYPKIRARGIRDNNEEIDISGDFIVAGTDSAAQRVALRTALFKKAIAAFARRDADLATVAKRAVIVGALQPLDDSKEAVPGPPAAPTIVAQATPTTIAEGATLDISGVTDSNTSKVLVRVISSSPPVRDFHNSTLSPRSNKYALSIGKPAVAAKIFAESVNLIGQRSAPASLTITP